MKDVLAFLVRQKTLTSGSVSCTQVLETWLPLVEKLAAAQKKDTAEMLSTLLFNALHFAAEKIHKSGINIDANEEDMESKADKSGTLCKVPDNCLSHALSFLSHEDILLNVELSCHRLFHVSRTRKAVFNVPFKCMTPLASAEYSSACVAMATQRLATDTLYTEELPNTAASLRLAELLKDGVAFLRSNTNHKVMQCAFPQLKHALLYANNDERTSVTGFLRRHPALHKLSCRCVGEMPSDLYPALAEMKQLTHVAICGSEIEEKEMEEWLAVDLTHVQNAKLHGFAQWAFIRPFLHPQLQQLTLNPKRPQPLDFDIVLPNVRILTLEWEDFIDRTDVIPSIERISAPKLTELRVLCHASEVLCALRLCPKGRLHFCLDNIHKTLTASMTDAIIEELRRESASFEPKQLELYLFAPSRGPSNAQRIICFMADLFAPRTSVTFLGFNLKSHKGSEYMPKNESITYRESTLEEHRYFFSFDDVRLF